MPRVVVAGAGFGGIATAVALRRELARTDAEIVLIDRRVDFVMGLRKSWAVLGISTIETGRRPLADIAGVTLETGEITAIRPDMRAVEVDGRIVAGDALVLALGASHAMDAVRGLAEFGINIWDRAEADRARAAVSGLTRGQAGTAPRLAIGIFGAPYSCPPAPFEFALLARDSRGSDVDIFVFSPAPIALPVVGPAESAKVEAMLSEASVSFLTRRQATSVDAHEVRFADGTAVPFDVLLAVPPHRCPDVLVSAGLAEPGGWVMPDPRTLETSYPGVYAIGDCTTVPLANGMALPKAGIFAEREGEVVASRIAAMLRGEQSDARFSGEGFCYLEAGAGRAAMAAGAFMADPVAVRISEPSAEALAEKRVFERSRLKAWFGR